MNTLVLFTFKPPVCNCSLHAKHFLRLLKALSHTDHRKHFTTIITSYNIHWYSKNTFNNISIVRIALSGTHLYWRFHWVWPGRLMWEDWRQRLCVFVLSCVLPGGLGTIQALCMHQENTTFLRFRKKTIIPQQNIECVHVYTCVHWINVHSVISHSIRHHMAFVLHHF